MSWKVILRLLSLCAFLFLSACQVVMGTPAAPPTSTPTYDPQVDIDQAVAATLTAQAQIALAVQQTLTALIPATLQPTELSPFTLTPSFTATTTPTPTSEHPTVRVSIDTRCRTGPGTAYDILGILRVGQTAEVVGRSHNNDNWIILMPDEPAITCWLWAFYATIVSGDAASLPVVPHPATPTPPSPH
jgi:hypothetical protein